MTPVMIAAIIVGIVVGAVVIFTITKLTLPKLKAYLKKRKEKKARQKVVFGDTRKIINNNAEEILQKAPKMKREELEKICEETPYFVVDVDEDTEETSDFTLIKTDETGKDLESFMQNNRGIVVFD